jgi:hypothetical protein
MSQKIWVVEMKVGNNWEPTIGVGLTREDGRLELARWRGKNPTYKFRLVKYEAGW